MHFARFSTLSLAVVLASPALWDGFVTRQMPQQTALLRLLIAVPVAAFLLAVFRTLTKGYGQERRENIPLSTIPGQPDPQSGPLRAEAVTGEPLARRTAD